MMDLEQSRIDQFWEDGYETLPDVFSPEEVEELRKAAYVARGHGGDLLSSPHLRDFVLHPGMRRAAEQLLGAPPIYIGDSGCVFGGESGFHKDNPDRHDANGPDWTLPDRYTIIRFGLYLQDHANHSGGIGFRHGSHNLPPRNAGRSVYAASRVGDLVAWTLRTTHRGSVDFVRWPRILLARKLARLLPAAVKLPRPEGDRVALFCSYATDGPHLERLIDYLHHRTWALERWRESVYDDETRAAIERSGLTVRDLRAEALAQDPSQATFKHAPLPY